MSSVSAESRIKSETANKGTEKKMITFVTDAKLWTLSCHLQPPMRGGNAPDATKQKDGLACAPLRSTAHVL